MSELRQDRTSGEWVIVAPQRGKRPGRGVGAGTATAPLPPFDPACPFCPGNEEQLPGILSETPRQADPGWQVRVIPNKYPALNPEASAVELPLCGHRVRGGFGFHEVIIESPRHDGDLVGMSDDEIETVLSAYFLRFSTLLEQPGIKTVILFRNHGQTSGASLVHPHAQLIATAIVPPSLQARADWAHEHFRNQSHCVMCEELALEQAAGARLIEETSSFVALVPYAAMVPFEVWLVPRRHQASFTEMDAAECRDLGVLLRRTLQRLRSLHNDPAYNFVIDSAAKDDRHAPYLHWRLRIAPDLVTWGGFELGTRMPINPSRPEQDAELLRDTTE